MRVERGHARPLLPARIDPVRLSLRAGGRSRRRAADRVGQRRRDQRDAGGRLEGGARGGRTRRREGRGGGGADATGDGQPGVGGRGRRAGGRRSLLSRVALLLRRQRESPPRPGAFGTFALLPVLVVALVWVALLALTRIVSLSSVLAATCFPIAFYYLADPPQQVALCAAAAVLVIIWRHRDNLARLVRGEEPRVGKKGRPS